MSGWVKMSEAWFEEARTEEVGAEAAMVHLSGLAYSARHLTDGFLPRRAMRRLYPAADLDATVAALTDADLWRTVEGGFLIVDWASHILPADEVEHRREQTRITSERHRRHKEDDHSMCDRCWFIRKHGDGVTHGITDGISDPPPNRSDPIRPGGEERGGEVESDGSASSDGSAGAPPPPPAPPPGSPVRHLSGPPPGVIPTVNGVPVWGPGSKSGRTIP